MTRQIAILLAVLGGACSRDSAPTPSTSPTPRPGGLRPLSSREGNAAPAFAPEASPTLPPGHPSVGGETVAARPLSDKGVAGSVGIAAGLRDRSAPTDVLFIIARNSKSQQILAVRKEQGVRFPFRFHVSGADAMVPDTPFVGPVDITARLSRSGDAMPVKGDIEGTTKGVAAGAKDVTVTLEVVRQ